MSNLLDISAASSIFDTMDSNHDECPLPRSFEEQSVGIQLGGMLLLLGGYFVIAGVLLARGVRDMATFVTLFIVATVLMIAVYAAGHAILALFGEPEDRDERDRLIAWKAEARSSWILGAGLIGAAGCVAAGTPPIWTLNLLLLTLFLSHIHCYTLRFIAYRRGS